MGVSTESLARAGRVLRTVRHLRSSQIAWRVGRAAHARLRRFAPSRDISAVASPPFLSDAPVPSDLVWDGCNESPEELVRDLQANRLTLVNRPLEFSIEKPNWRLGEQRQDRLWVITLHYHQWLLGFAQEVSRNNRESPWAGTVLKAALRDWLTNCGMAAPGAKALAWNSYAIATRLGVWAKLWEMVGSSFWEGESSLAESFVSSMYQQARFLADHLEWDLRANHLLRDAVGLAWAGRFFAGEEARRWTRLATRLAVSQANEQVLRDGGHFERSPFYHCEVMEDWRTLAALLEDEQARRKMRSAWGKCATFAEWLRHPDGRLVQFNDGSATEIEDTFVLGRNSGLQWDSQPRRGGKHFLDFGIAVWHGQRWSVFVDVGEVGVDYQPGHAHADTLTVECSLDGERLFVDPGCYGYDHDDRRRYDRATESHNTVCIDDTDSSEVWHIFRVGRRARVKDVRVQFTELSMSCEARHTGYEHLRGTLSHKRVVEVDESGPLRVQDELTGKGRHRASGGYLLAPGWQAQSLPDGWLLWKGKAAVKITLEASSSLALRTESRPYHPDYGVEIMTTRIAWTCECEFPLRVVTTVQPHVEEVT